MESLKKNWSKIPTPVRQITVLVVGILTIIIGLLLSMPLVPGPGLAVIFLGFAIIATEFIWAKRLCDWTVSRFKAVYKTLRSPKSLS